jgi:hypothetical protein
VDDELAPTPLIAEAALDAPAELGLLPRPDVLVRVPVVEELRRGRVAVR